MSRRLADRVGVITGASRGIGRSIAIHCAREGARVVLVARTESDLRKTADEIRKEKGQAAVIPADVTDLEQVERLREETERQLGPADFLVNDAGRLDALGPTWQTEPENWWSDVAVNIRGVYLCCRVFLPGMIERGRGRVINMVGGGTRKPFLFGSGYGCSKAAVMRLTESIADELQEEGSTVKIFALSPGLVRTEMTEQFLESEPGRKWMKRLADRLKEGNDVPPDRAARMVVTLASGWLDGFHGRYLNSERDLDDLDSLRERATDIAEKDLRVLRMTM